MKASTNPSKQIKVTKNGPYVVTNVDQVEDYLGQKIAPQAEISLCRCGASQRKPFCDGSHTRINFNDEKDPERVADQRGTYVGQQVTILDNRGICQHSGYCTDRLKSVFRQNQEPFVAPSGGRMDEIIRAVRDCPSGALSYALDGVEAREQVDFHGTRSPKIVITQDGPYRVTGAIPLIDADDTPVARDEGASLEHYALCRCGKSQNKPFCSGMHWYVDFHDPVADEEHESTIFEWAGGYPAMLRMTRIFYEKLVPQDELLSPVFAAMSADHPERVAKWLSEVFSGPPDYSKEYGGYSRMLSEHLNKRLREDQRSQWANLMLQAAQEANLPNDAEFRAAFGSYIEWGSRLAVENSQQGVTPPANMPMPKWGWRTAAGPPGSRVSTLPETTEVVEEIVVPAAGETVSYEDHVRPLFRKTDRQAMKFVFDLWDLEDVKQHADNIFARVKNGSMPPDAAWSEEKVALFRRWQTSGMNR